MDVWINGQYVPADDAKVPLFDAGFQHGVGLFETMAAFNGRVFRARAHVDRLAESARLLSLTERLHVEPLVEAVQATVERNGLERSRVRLTITGGDLNMLQSTGASQQDPTVIVVTQPPTPYPDAFFEQGVCVVFASGRINPWSTDAGHKTLNYWPRIHALQEAAMTKAGEALWLTPDAHVASGSVSNLFLVSGETLVTPPARGEAESPVLPGITRAAVIELADTLNLEVQLRQVSMNEFLAADEVFLTNSSWQVLPVSSYLVRTRSEEHVEGEDAVGIEHRPIGEGTAGPVTLDVRTALLAMIDRETG